MPRVRTRPPHSMRWLLISCALALSSVMLVSLPGCSKPAVKYGSIDGTVRSVSNWTIEWHGRTEQAPSATIDALDRTRTKYTLPEYCEAYVDEIRRSLSRTHGFPFYENMPATGRIEVTLYGANVTRAGISRTDAERMMDELSGDWRGDRYIESAIRQEGFDWGREDIVKKVDITVYDITGKILAQIVVGGNPEDRVKPGYVAEALAKAFEGK